MSNCAGCLKPIGTKQLKCSCSDCKKTFHGNCVGMNKSEIEYLASMETLWRCEPCSVTRRKSLRLESQSADGKLSLNDIMNAIKSLEQAQKNCTVDFNKANELLTNKIDDNTKLFNEQAEKINSLLEKVEALTAENKQLKNRVSTLEEELDETQQYSRRNCVEIQGLPVENEDVLGAVKRLGSALGMEVTDNMVDACHTLGKRPEATGPPAVIVKFVRRIDADAMLSKKRSKRQLSTRHLDFPSDNPIYVNESLTPLRRRLLGKARVARKERGYKWLWVRGGRIFIRKEDGGTVKVIKCQADIDNM